MLMQLSVIFACLPFVGWFVPCFSEEFGTIPQESPAKRSSCLIHVSFDEFFPGDCLIDFSPWLYTSQDDERQVVTSPSILSTMVI